MNVLCVADHSQLTCCRCGSPLSRRHRRTSAQVHNYCSRVCGGKARRVGPQKMTSEAGKTYFYLYFPEHPRANKGGYVPLHTWTAEQKLGRFLREYEVAHHLDGDGENNEPGNLLVVPSVVNRWLGPWSMN